MKQSFSMRLNKSQIERVEKLASILEKDETQIERVTKSFVVRLAIQEGLKVLERKTKKHSEGKSNGK
jgi:hypothetical protein